MRIVSLPGLIAVAGLALGAAAARAGSLPGGMTEAEIKKVASIAGFGSIHRAWTGADVPNEDLGLSIGVEASFVFKQSLTDVGSGDGYSPRIIPVPRLYAAWDLPWRTTVSGSYSPGNHLGGIGGFGLAAQLAFFRADDPQFSLSAVVHYTRSYVFNDLVSHTTGVAFQAGKDLTIWQPYMGLGFLVANATADADVVAAGVDRGPHGVVRPHVYAGFRIDLGAKLGFQFDLAGRRPSLAVVMIQQF